MSQNFLNNNSDDDKLTKRQIGVSYWIVTHKVLLKQILAGILIALGGVLWLFSLYLWIDYAFITGPKERANLAQWADINTEKQVGAENLVVGEPIVFSGGVGQYDMLVEVGNSNKDWYVEFDYRFVGEGLSGDWKSGFLLPVEKKYITNLGLERAFRPSNVRVEFNNVRYSRVNNHEISDYDTWSAERFDIEILNKDFNPRAIAGKKTIASLNFDVYNKSAYSYWTVGLYSLLYSGDKLVSINYITTEQLMAGETRELQINFYEGLPSISKIEIVPEINLFDKSVFISQI